MAYYIRFVVADDRPVTLADIETALRETGRDYRIAREADNAVIQLAGRPVGRLSVHGASHPGLEGERAELMAPVAKSRARGKARVLDMLRAASGIVAVEVLFEDEETEDTLSALDPIWSWLVEHRQGMVQADGEGYYDGEGKVLTVR